MPPRSRPSSMSSPLDLLPRIITSATPSSSSSDDSAGQYVPLLLSRPSSAGPSSPLRGPGSRQNSLSPTSPSSPFSFAPPPRAARLGGSGRKWVLLAGILVVGGLVVGSWSAGVRINEEYHQELREKWNAGIAGVKSWTAWGATVEEEPTAGGEAGEAQYEPLGDDVDLAALRAAERPEATAAPVAPHDALDDRIGDDEEPAVLAEEEADASSAQDEADPVEEELPTVLEEEEAAAVVAAAVPEGAIDFTDAIKLNVHPVPRPPPSDPTVASETKYLSFENHSGFHNQRKSLVNALALAQLLNRTLLLPPARLGSPIPWGPEVNNRLTHSERCKAGLEHDPIAKTTNSAKIGSEECDDPQKWTYVGWEYLVTPRLLEGRQLVDRWNSSFEWFYDSTANGGLGLRRDEVREFDDPERRSYQIYDSRSTPTDKSGLFASRIDLEDLAADESRLLRFGSLFSGARLKLSREENQKVLVEANENMILRSEGLDKISDEVRDLLGSYVAAHARVGDGVFKNQARPNMLKVFRRLASNVLGMRRKTVDALLAEFELPASHKSKGKGGGAAKGGRERRARAFGTAPELGAEEKERDEVDDDDGDDPRDAFPSYVLRRTPSSSRSFSSSPSPRSLQKRGPTTPLSPTLHCRSPLHDLALNPSYAPLNTPLYIATDSRAPASDPALAPFFKWFPCIFLLNDFVEEEGKGGVSDKPVEELVRLVDARDGEVGGWTSEWDGQAMARYLYPFLEAEIAARGVEVVGTPMSTFSGYTSGILHEAYVAQGMVAGWSDDESSSSSAA
ncbi:hypothetical protein JCM6882_009067 [Rhodosporidiobolus microsporus]